MIMKKSLSALAFGPKILVLDPATAQRGAISMFGHQEGSERWFRVGTKKEHIHPD
jgi:hypothetical protein